jgi:hypothetical protein
MQATKVTSGKGVLQALRNQLPVRDLPGVRIRAVKAQPEDAFDVLHSGEARPSSRASCGSP